MKKLFAAISLGTLLVAGFLFTNADQPSDLAGIEPSVFSIGDDLM